MDVLFWLVLYFVVSGAVSLLVGCVFYYFNREEQ